MALTSTKSTDSVDADPRLVRAWSISKRLPETNSLPPESVQRGIQLKAFGGNALNASEVEEDEYALVHKVTRQTKASPNTQASFAFNGPVQKHVNGVVAEISGNIISVALQLPNDRVVADFPKSLIPAELQEFGTPLTISIEEVDGFRVPAFARRQSNIPAETLDKIQEIDRWIESL